jgi:DNA-binding CsgD family transcriptional regulator
MGKTTALDHVRDQAVERDFEVLETRGIEADTALGFGALLTLLRPIDHELDALVGDFADDLRSAVTLGTRHPTDDGRVRLALYRAVTTLAERRPLAVLVDDAHLVDGASAAALAFAIGRLGRDRVATVLASDDGLSGPFGDLGLPTEALRALPLDALEQLVTDAVGPVAPDALQRCCELAEGNPLIALELARSLSDDERAGRVEVNMLPRPPEALARRYALRFAGYGEAATRALAVAAADDTGRAAVVRAALQELGEPPDALDRAEETGVLTIDGPTIRFAHPLLRTVAYHRLAAPSRRAAHRALAVALAAPDDAVARAWQLAAAADGEDENAADALTLVAGDLVRRGASRSAARVFERAASLSPSPDARAERQLRAAETWLDAFAAEAAARAVAPLVPTTQADVLAGVASVLSGALGPLAALEPVRAASRGNLRSLARALEADLLVDAVGDDAARDVATSVRDETADADARALADVVVARTAGAVPDTSDDVPDGRLGRLVRRRCERAAAEAGVAVTSIDAGRDGVVTRALADRHAGRLTAAFDRLQVELTLVPAGAAQQRAPLELVLVDVEHLLGRTDDARARAEALAVRLDATRGLAAGAHWVLGRLHVAAGDLEQGCAVLETAAAARRAVFGPELAVTLVALGRPHAAERVLGDAPTAPGPVAAARFERARAAVRADDDAFRTAERRAREQHLPVEAGETLLVFAEHLHRAQRTDDAREVASRAAETFDAIGLRGWDARLAHLVDGTSAAPGVAAELTSAEYRVALAVSNGATNREAAADLFLSVKTVDFHLQNIYRKLGLRSRTELAVLMRGDGGGGR